MDEDDIEDAPVDALPSGAPSGISDNVEVLAEHILELTCSLVKLNILLTEADEREWSAVKARLAALRRATELIPKAPTQRRTMGFKGKQTRVKK